MNIVIPLNTSYLRDRYFMDDSFIERILYEVIPELLSRLSLDSRVESIELISNSRVVDSFSINDKVVLTEADFGTTYDRNEVITKIFSYRYYQTEVVVQMNPLYPFVSVDSIAKAYESVMNKESNSALGSYTDLKLSENLALAKELDMGVFNVYREECFKQSGNRVSVPLEVIGLKALELICLRSENDIELYELVVNSGLSV